MNIEELDWETALPKRFWDKVDSNGPSPVGAPHLGPCWLWTRARVAGYGAFRVNTGVKFKTILAHRLAHFDAGGDVAEDLDVDHMCHVPACVNPSHLRAIPHASNIQNLRGAYARSKTGVRGVCRLKNGQYRAEAQANKVRYYIGRFATLEEAEVAVIAFRREHMPTSLMDQEERPLAA